MQTIVSILFNTQAENTHLLCMGKYHCMADVLFCSSGFSCFAYVELARDLLVFWSYPNRLIGGQ